MDTHAAIRIRFQSTSGIVNSNYRRVVESIGGRSAPGRTERNMLIVGRLHRPGETLSHQSSKRNGKLTIRAGRELQLRCGDAAIN